MMVEIVERLDQLQTVREIRDASGLSIRQMSAASGVPQSTLYDLEAGTVQTRQVHLNAVRYAALKHLWRQ